MLVAASRTQQQLHRGRHGGGLVADQPLVVRTEALGGVQLVGGGAVFVHRLQAPTHAPPSRPGLGRLTAEDTAEMRRLRAEDPSHWTQRRLAERFGVNALLVARVAPAPAERFAQLEEEQQLRQLRQVFGERRSSKSSSSPFSASDQQRTNRAKFQRQVAEHGGLKATLKQHNMVPKHRRKGTRPPMFQVADADVVMDSAEYQPGVVGPEVDFAKATQPFAPRSLTRDEAARVQRSIDASRSGNVDAATAKAEADEFEREVQAVRDEARAQRILPKYRRKQSPPP